MRRHLLAGAVCAAAAPALAADPLPSMVWAPPVRLAAAPAYHLQPSGVAVPDGARPGSVSRTVTPFGPWTLICDAIARRRVCMASQTLVDAAGAMSFSWSLAGTDGGGPVLILRAPARAAGRQAARLALPSGERRDVPLDTCADAVCVGFLPVDAAINRAIAAEAPVGVATADMPSVATPLKGLAAAVASLR